MNADKVGSNLPKPANLTFAGSVLFACIGVHLRLRFFDCFAVRRVG